MVVLLQVMFTLFMCIVMVNEDFKFMKFSCFEGVSCVSCCADLEDLYNREFVGIENQARRAIVASELEVQISGSAKINQRALCSLYCLMDGD